MSSLFRSLCLTVLLSFVTPVLLLGSLFLTLLAVSYIPGISLVGQIGESHILSFLSTFGDGYPIQGVFTIGITFSTVGGLFDVFNFCLYQDVQSH